MYEKSAAILRKAAHAVGEIDGTGSTLWASQLIDPIVRPLMAAVERESERADAAEARLAEIESEMGLFVR